MFSLIKMHHSISHYNITNAASRVLLAAIESYASINGLVMITCILAGLYHHMDQLVLLVHGPRLVKFKFVNTSGSEAKCYCI